MQIRNNTTNSSSWAKHTITTNTNKIIHGKRIRKPLPNSIQNPLSKRGENARGQDGRFSQQTAFLPIKTSAEEEEEEGQTENAEHRQSNPTPNTSTWTMETSSEFSSPIQIGRGRPKLIRDRTANNTRERTIWNSMWRKWQKNNWSKHFKRLQKTQTVPP